MNQSDSYNEALQRAAAAMAGTAASDKKRSIENNPIYAVGSALEPVAQVADLGLGLAGLPPVASATVSGVKSLGAAMEGGDPKDLANSAGSIAGAASAFMQWKTADEKRKSEMAQIEEFRKLFSGGVSDG
jgi:succinylarginine dihydrolase